MRIACLGISHRTAGVELRERLAFDEGRTEKALANLHDRWPDASFAILSTCNRTEVYVVRALHGHPREEELRSWLGRRTRVDRDTLDPVTYWRIDGDACRQLFSVCAGLDSLVPGEAQIVSQVKNAYALAQRMNSAGKYLNELFQTALRAAKEVRSKTPIATGKVSVASVAVQTIRNVLGDLDDKTALLIGAGKISRLTLEHMRGAGIGRIGICNRSLEKARRLASGDDRVVPYRSRGDRLADADVVICSTASKRPILTREMIVSAQQHRRWKPLLLIDLAVPRDIDSSAANLKNVHIMNVDDFESAVEKNMKSRKGQQSRAFRIIDRHVRRIAKSLDLREVIPTIEALYERMDDLAADELRRAGRKLSTHEDFEEDERIVRQALHRITRRFLHPAAKQLRSSAGTEDSRTYVDALRELFSLDTGK